MITFSGNGHMTQKINISLIAALSSLKDPDYTLEIHIGLRTEL